MTELKMFCIEAATTPPSATMVYAVSKSQANALYRDTYLVINEASALQITAHVRAKLPILGEPTPPDPNQQTLKV